MEFGAGNAPLRDINSEGNLVSESQSHHLQGSWKGFSETLGETKPESHNESSLSHRSCQLGGI